MKTTKLAALSAMTIAAIGLAAGTAYADPAPAPAPSDALNVELAPHINYKAYDNGASAVITTDAGTLNVADGKLQIKDNAGIVVGGLPLQLGIDQFTLPISAKVEGNTATLTPELDKAVYHDVALPFEESAPWKTPYEREQAAWTRFTSTVSLGAAIGVIIGAVSAAVVGCAAGIGLVAIPATPVILGSFGALAAVGIPAALLGCVGGAALFAPVGTLVGAIAVGAPVAIAAGIQYFTTINAPFKAPAPAK